MSETLYRFWNPSPGKHVYRKSVCDTSCEYDECWDSATKKLGVKCDGTFYPRCWNPALDPPNWQVAVPCCTEEGYDCADWHTGCNYTSGVSFPFGCYGCTPFGSPDHKWFCLKWYISIFFGDEGKICEQMDNTPSWFFDDGADGLVFYFDYSRCRVSIYWVTNGTEASEPMTWETFSQGSTFNFVFLGNTITMTWGNVLYGV